MTNAVRGWARLAILGATLGIIAFCVGRGSSQLLAAALFDDPPPSSAPASVATAPPPPDGCTMIDGHQVFDSALHVRCDDAPLPPTPPLATGGEPAPCSPGVRLVGAYVRRGDAEQSFAAITTRTGASLLYREGMNVDAQRVVAIDDRSVILATADGARCRLGMFEEAGPPLAVAGDLVPVLDTRRTPESTAAISSHVERLGDGRYAIDRGFLTEAISTRAWASARVVPEERDGRVVGMRVFGVRASSLLGELGIRNGDSIHSVDGHDATDPVAMLEALARLSTAARVSVSLVRDGAPATLDYEIR